MNNYLLYSIIGINLWVFLLMATDKVKAMNNRWRIKERTLLAFGFFGGSIGLLIAMLLFRHKIKNIKFILLAPLFLAIHLFIVNM